MHIETTLTILFVLAVHKLGWEFADQFRKTYDNSSPIVVVTAAADSEQRAKDINATGWVSKPFELEVLLKKIKECEN